MKGSKKNLIDQAAIELFAQHGIYAATVKDITSRAGVTEAALYRHYKSKEEMAARLYLATMESVISVLASVGPAPPFSRQIHKAVESLYQYYDEQPSALIFLIRNFHIIQTIEDQDLRGLLYDFISQYALNLCGQDNPALDYELLPSLVSGLILQPIIFHYYKKLPGPPSHYAAAIAASCCRVLGIDYEN